jgi:hypothetical protein
MPRIFYVNGETMVTVTGAAGTAISTLRTQLGLATNAVQVTQTYHQKDIIVDAYGQQNPPELQVFGGEAMITMDLVDFDPLVLAECIRLSMGGAPAEGLLARAGALMGGGVALGVAGNNYINLNLSSPVAGLPYNFPSAYLHQQPVVIPLGTEKSITRLTWRAIAYSVDPWNNGLGSFGAVLYNRVA